MKIFKENDKIRLQLYNITENIMLFDFTVEKEVYNELKEHMIEHLNKFEV